MTTGTSPGRRAGPRPLDGAAVVGLLLGLPVLTWWLVGDLSITPSGDSPDAARLDYAVEPPHVDVWAVRLAAALALVVLISAAVALLRPRGVLRADPRWWLVLTPLVLAAAALGAAGRVVTAGVYGANIGAGLVVVVGVPLLVLVLLWCTAWSLYLATRGRRTG